MFDFALQLWLIASSCIYSYYFGFKCRGSLPVFIASPPNTKASTLRGTRILLETKLYYI